MTSTEPSESALCPCGSAEPFETCCGPCLSGERPAATAEQLMRSRYTAFTRADVDYIRESLHPRARKEHDEDSTRQWAEQSEWLGLEVVDTDGGRENQSRGTVEFIARFRRDGELVEHHEIATFVKDKERWLFLDSETPGVETYVRETPKVGRNEPCPCGSGKKFKRCCAAAAG